MKLHVALWNAINLAFEYVDLYRTHPLPLLFYVVPLFINRCTLLDIRVQQLLLVDDNAPIEITQFTNFGLMAMSFFNSNSLDSISSESEIESSISI